MQASPVLALFPMERASETRLSKEVGGTSDSCTVYSQRRASNLCRGPLAVEPCMPRYKYIDTNPTTCPWTWPGSSSRGRSSTPSVICPTTNST